MRAVDLHTHTNCSDGTFTPRELMDYAVGKGLRAIALTDHDTTRGLDEAEAHIRENALPLELVPGIELSTMWHIEEEDRDQEVHVVGLFIDRTDPALQAHLDEFVSSRVNRNRKMCEKLTEAGMPVSMEELERDNPGAVITRAHFARFMLEHGYVKDKKEVFAKYIGEDCPYYIPRKKVSPCEAVRVIREAGGVAVLAHPILYRITEAQLETLARGMQAAGMRGIEAIYSTYTEAEERTVRRLAKKLRLAVSGGSDFHGTNKPGIDLAVGYGKLFVPEEILETLRSIHQEQEVHT
ncbi:MAG: PHP domain-containing protein [Lachnospiraceae bacterium]|nr:PHP domain-containing protein [Lachnospiraceae bacterium]